MRVLHSRSGLRWGLLGLLVVVLGLGMSQTWAAPTEDSAPLERRSVLNVQFDPPDEEMHALDGSNSDPASSAPAGPFGAIDLARTAQTVALFAVLSLAPVAVLMTTAFVRIHVVLLLLRQALGSPQVPGNQVLTALAVLLTALVMTPVAEVVYARAIQPYADGELPAADAWRAGSEPIKKFMIDQIVRTQHEHYLVSLHDYHQPAASDPSADLTRLPLRVVAPAFLLSELTTALWIGFLIYLPFLVIDLVVSAVLAATGLIMLPPAQVALPLKLILFVLADGWWLVADALLKTFAIGAGSS